jgi:haloalkane dehalogenase
MQRPFQVDPTEYPFEDNWIPYHDGYIHYIEEGTGPTILLLHGNPTWSYLYRNVIKELQNEFRLVAFDYPGFGMSKAPSHYQYTPQEHAKSLTYFIQQLNLKDFILVVQDWGGPIGMSYAVDHPEKINGIVLMNTWAWPTTLPAMKIFSLAMGGWPVGYWLQTKKNFFAKTLVPNGIHHNEKITENLKRAYVDPFPTPESRKPTWVFPRSITKAHKWLAEIESKLLHLAHIPTQILWGTKDSAGFPLSEMEKWQKYLKRNETEILNDASHYVQEDRPDRIAAAIRRATEKNTFNDKEVI